MLTDPRGTVNASERRSASAASRAGDRERSRYAAIGRHAALAFVEARPGDVDRVMIGRDVDAAIVRLLDGATVHVERVDRDALERVAQGIPHQGVVAIGRPPHELVLEDLLRRDPLPDLVLVLDEVTDPRNVGAMLRSAEAAGAGAVVLSRDRAPHLSPALVKAAAGAVEWLPLVRVVNIARTLDALQKAGYWTVGLAGEAAVGIHDRGAVPGFPVALVVGSEGEGMRPLVRRSCDRLVRIPMGGRTPSLNASVAAAIALFEVRRLATDRLVGGGVPAPKP